jgi:RNA-directed DNA polymerase
MEEPYSKGLASHAGPKSCAVGREAGREALTGVCTGRVLSLEKIVVRGADAVFSGGRQHRVLRHGEKVTNPAWSETSCMYRTISRENREIPGPPEADGASGRAGKSQGHKPAMHGHGKSDGCVVPTKFPNNGKNRKEPGYDRP